MRTHKHGFRRMSKLYLAVTAGIAMALAIAALNNSFATPVTPPPNVVSTIYDFDATNNQLLLRSDDHNATGQASYSVADTDVISYVASDQWDLNLSNQTLRRVFLTFSSPANNSVPAPLPDGYYNARVLSRCFDNNNNIFSLFQIAPGTTNNRCSLRIPKIDFAGTEYLLVMTPDGTEPGTGWANVTCTAGNSSGCTAWHIEPNIDSVDFPGNVPTVAHLYSVAAHNGKLTFIGSYHNTYRADFHE